MHDLARLHDAIRKQVSQLPLHADVGDQRGQQQQALALPGAEEISMRQITEVIEHDDRRARLLAGNSEVFGIDDGARGQHAAASINEIGYWRSLRCVRIPERRDWADSRTMGAVSALAMTDSSQGSICARISGEVARRAPSVCMTLMPNRSDGASRSSWSRSPSGEAETDRRRHKNSCSSGV